MIDIHIRMEALAKAFTGRTPKYVIKQIYEQWSIRVDEAWVIKTWNKQKK
jgi:hypothetical protein